MSAVWELISLFFLSTACFVLALIHGADRFAFFFGLVAATALAEAIRRSWT
jgi:hypothetical protein